MPGRLERLIAKHYCLVSRLSNTIIRVFHCDKFRSGVLSDADTVYCKRCRNDLWRPSGDFRADACDCTKPLDFTWAQFGNDSCHRRRSIQLIDASLMSYDTLERNRTRAKPRI